MFIQLKKTFLLLLLLTICFTGSILVADISLVKKHLANSAIIIPNKAIAPEKLAAEELQYHIQKASGAKLLICKENDTPDSNNLIYIGKCQATSKAGIDVSKLSPSGYVIKTIGKNLFLAGKDRERSTWGLRVGSVWAADWQGTLFAVYDFLENDLGVRWLWPGKLGEIIPSTSDIIIKHIDRQGKPKFLSAWLNLPDKYPKGLTGWNLEKNKKNFLRNQRMFLLRHRFSAVQSTRYGHNYQKYWKRFGKTHPEFFSLLPNGKREPLKGDSTGFNITLCVSQPALWKQIISEWKKSPLRNPENMPYKPFVNACENDTPGMCLCTACRAWDYPDPEFEKSDYWGKKIMLESSKRFLLANAIWGEGVDASDMEPASLSDRYAKFYLALLKEAKKVDPKAKVYGYAYANYWKAPKSTKLNEDIIISYVQPLWFPYTEKMSKKFRKNWAGWHKDGAQMILRPNLTHAGANLPIFYARRFAKDFSFAAKNGMIATSFDSLLGAWSTQGPTLYTLTRIHEHPEWSADKILNEYYSGFGKASKTVKKYFEYWEAHSNSLDEKTVKKYCSEERDRRGKPGGSFKNYVLIAARIFPPEVFVNAHKLINIAKKSAKGDKLAEQRVAYLEKGLVDAELTVAVRAAQKTAEKTPSNKNKKAFLEAFKKLKSYRASVEQDNVCNFGYMAYREKGGAGWPWTNKVQYKRKGKKLSGPWKFQFDEAENGHKKKWQSPEFNDSTWSTIATDSPWEEQEQGKKWFKEHKVDFNGIAWYRTKFKISPSLKNHIIELTFGAVDEACNIYLNGKLIHKRIYNAAKNARSWDEPFSVDITKYVNINGENYLAVRVEDRRGAGGITRPVFINYKNRPGQANISFEKAEGYKVGKTKPKGWEIWHNHKKFNITGKDKQMPIVPDGTQMLRASINCGASKQLFNETFRKFYAAVSLAYISDISNLDISNNKNYAFARFMFHRSDYLWRGVEIGFVQKNNVCYAGYRDGSTWEILDLDLNKPGIQEAKEKVFYRFFIHVYGDGKRYDLKIYDLNGKLKGKASNIKTHGQVNFNTVSTYVIPFKDNKKRSTLCVDDLVVDLKPIKLK